MPHQPALPRRISFRSFAGAARAPLPRRRAGPLLTSLSALALAACTTSGFDPDLRGRIAAGGLDTSGAAQTATAPRPQPDARGVISYPNYQVVVAQRGDTVGSVAARVGIAAEELARYNAVPVGATLGQGEVLALPGRVAAAPTGAGGAIDITTIASGAIDRAQGGSPAAGGTAAPVQGGPEPVRHRVLRGETAYTIARMYNVSVKSLADWNGLSGDLAVREGQYLLIPVAMAGAAQPVSATAITTQPGTGSPTPAPPSASQPLPAETTTAAAAATPKPPAADMGAQTTTAAQFAMPVSGSIIRPYAKGKNDGIDISASAGAPVKAAEAGTVAAITKDTDQVPILVIRHANNLLTVYANIDGITVQKGASVSRGQTIAAVRAGSPAFLHFEVRNGYDSVDPMRYLQ